MPRWEIPNTARLLDLIRHSGVLDEPRLQEALLQGAVQLAGEPVQADCAVQVGDEVMIGSGRYRVATGGGQGRWQLQDIAADGTERITAPVRVHAGYHKCLTEYAKKVYGRLCRSRFPGVPARRFQHFYHRRDAFYQHCSEYDLCSVSGQLIDLDRFDDIRVVRFIRDPRDLLVSAYHYHRRAAEHWCELPDPTDSDWVMVNGKVPEALPAGQSLAEFLQQAPLEQGLLAELDFRQYHFESMRQWPEDDPRVRLFRYEDILGREAQTFAEIGDFFGLPLASRMALIHYARRYRAARKGGKRGHIRNPDSGQWRQVFTPALTQNFNERYGDLLARYGYPAA